MTLSCSVRAIPDEAQSQLVSLLQKVGKRTQKYKVSLGRHEPANRDKLECAAVVYGRSRRKDLGIYAETHHVKLAPMLWATHFHDLAATIIADRGQIWLVPACVASKIFPRRKTPPARES